MPALARAVVGVRSSYFLPQYEGTREAIDDVNFKRYELAVRALKDVAIQGGDLRSGSSQLRSQAVSLCQGSRGELKDFPECQWGKGVVSAGAVSPRSVLGSLLVFGWVGQCYCGPCHPGGPPFH